MTLIKAVRTILNSVKGHKIGWGYNIYSPNRDCDIWIFFTRLSKRVDYVYLGDKMVMEATNGRINRHTFVEGKWEKKVLEEAEKIEHQHAKRKQV